jgi:phage gp29-like protein
MAIRKTLNKLTDGDMQLPEALMERDDALFAFSGEEKIQLWQRFDSKERTALKKLGFDW